MRDDTLRFTRLIGHGIQRGLMTIAELHQILSRHEDGHTPYWIG